jgi:hypothetical protein
MRIRMLLGLIALAITTLMFAGCSSEALDDVLGRKPHVSIEGISVDRDSSSVAVYVNRRDGQFNQFGIYRLTDPANPNSKVYLRESWVRMEAWGNSGGGKGIFVVSEWDGAALNKTSTYFVLVEAEADVWDYSTEYPDDTKPSYDAHLFRSNPDGTYSTVY